MVHPRALAEVAARPEAGRYRSFWAPGFHCRHHCVTVAVPFVTPGASLSLLAWRRVFSLSVPPALSLPDPPSHDRKHKKTSRPAGEGSRSSPPSSFAGPRLGLADVSPPALNLPPPAPPGFQLAAHAGLQRTTYFFSCGFRAELLDHRRQVFLQLLEPVLGEPLPCGLIQRRLIEPAGLSPLIQFPRLFDGLLYRDVVLGSPIGHLAVGEYGARCVAHGLLQRLPEQVGLAFVGLQLAAPRHQLCGQPRQLPVPAEVQGGATARI